MLFTNPGDAVMDLTKTQAACPFDPAPVELVYADLIAMRRTSTSLQRIARCPLRRFSKLDRDKLALIDELLSEIGSEEFARMFPDPTMRPIR